MKVWIIYLAILITLLAFVPYIISEYIIIDNNVNIGSDIKLYDHLNKKTICISLEDYIVGVVGAEMPAEFCEEALKAQAVAARTYLIKKLSADLPLHSDGDICTDHTHCQAYISSNMAKEKWGNNYSDYAKKIKSAVISTKGEYLAYNNEPANTVFHSCSNGITEKSADVWGGDIPYLTNVNSEGDYTKKDYQSCVNYSKNDFIAILENHLKVKIDDTITPVSNVILSSGNNVMSVDLFGHRINGTDIRKIFSLKATSFTLEYTEKEFIFTVSGSGHGVGMSQYGANALAKSNHSYSEILYHYYPGTKIVKMNK